MDRSPSAAFLEFQCSERESNSHGLPHTPLKRARLPVPPSELEKNLSLFRGRSRWTWRSYRASRGCGRSRGARRRTRCRRHGRRGNRRRRRGRRAFVNYRMSADTRQRENQREKHKEHRRDYGRFFERLLSAARAESRLAARSAESRRHISALPRLQQNNQDQEQTDDNENYFKSDVQQSCTILERCEIDYRS
jgi:hypothetical protein